MMAAKPYAHHGIRNTAIAEAIAHAFANGLHHPGNPQAGEPPTMLQLPMFRTAGMPPPMVDAVNTTAQTIADAIIYLIETGHGLSLVPTGELDTLRREVERLRVHQYPPLSDDEADAIAEAAMVLNGHAGGELSRRLNNIGHGDA